MISKLYTYCFTAKLGCRQATGIQSDSPEVKTPSANSIIAGVIQTIVPLPNKGLTISLL
ncbi:MAG: hypothetical protein ACTHLB_01435 [Parafilimonas sp.]